MAMTQASDPVLPPAGTGLPRKMTGGPAMLFPGGQGLPGHSPELNAEKIKEKLAAMKKRLSLTPEQEEKIRGILEAAQPKVRTAADGSMMLKLGQDAGEKQKTAEAIAAVLNDEQKEGYSSFRQEETANAAEAVANRELSQLQSATTLSAEQKDAAFAALSKIALEEQSQSLPDPGGDPSVVEAAMAARWNARQEALSGILTPEQQAVYQQSGNPNRAVTFRMSPEGKAVITEGKAVTK
jgi:Spy/CpxP family protein refolding chaperone